MTDLIDRAALIKALNKVAMEHHESHVPLVEHDFRELIHKAEAVDIKHGKWIRHIKSGLHYMECSCCNNRILSIYMIGDYCPNCGAKMEDYYERK